MLPGYPESAICVQRFDDSLNSAIHTTYRNWQRSSSRQEPRDSPLEVVSLVITTLKCRVTGVEQVFKKQVNEAICGRACAHLRARESPPHMTVTSSQWFSTLSGQWEIGNDPSAGSPTETLLRLLLPLNDRVYTSSQQSGSTVASCSRADLKNSRNHSIGSSDGRCVQRAGT